MNIFKISKKKELADFFSHSTFYSFKINNFTKGINYFYKRIINKIYCITVFEQMKHILTKN